MIDSRFVDRRQPFPRPWTEEEFAIMKRIGLFPNRAISLVDGQVVEAVPGDPIAQPVHFTREECYALNRENMYIDQHVELIGGIIYWHKNITPPQAMGIGLTNDALRLVFKSGSYVRTFGRITFGSADEPQADLSVVAGEIRDYSRAHPTTALLVVEVADNSLEFDTNEKAYLYAAGGIQDYWVLDVNARQLCIFRDPVRDPPAPRGYRYTTRLAFGPTDSVSPLAAPAASIRVADLLP